MIMVHSDDNGLVCPPKVARIQVVIVPIFKTGDDVKGICDAAEEIYKTLKQGGIRVHFDDRFKKNPGEKFNEWELKGIPLRLEFGPKDFQNKEVKCVKRNDGVKSQLKQATLLDDINALLTSIHSEMYNKALKSRQEKMINVDNWKDFMDALQQRCICLAPWCNEQSCEIAVKDRSKEESENML